MLSGKQIDPNKQGKELLRQETRIAKMMDEIP
jgi:hypothetical protein